MHKTVQRPGEFIIARAMGYHSGFNAGYNIAEAVNFAMPSWLEIGEKAKVCRCRKDSVLIDIE
jgi:[histone H3]-trimethyl-L-lysine9/36 demethylase